MQVEITNWAISAFGKQEPLTIASRMNNEVAELLTGLVSKPEDKAHHLAECADVYIMLVQVASGLGGDLMEEVREKLEINRNRQWEVTASGKVQHV